MRPSGSGERGPPHWGWGDRCSNTHTGSSGRRVLQDRGAPGALAAQQRTQGEVPSSLGYTFTFGLEIRVAELGSRFPSAQLPGGAAMRC